MAVSPVEAKFVVDTVITHGNKVLPWWKKYWRKIFPKKAAIVILGMPNVGKTLLLKRLAEEELSYYETLPVRSKKVESKEIILNKGHRFVKNFPGEISFVSDEYNLALHQNKRLEGMIYVVNYGYTLNRSAGNSSPLPSVLEVGELRKKSLSNELADFSQKLCDLKNSLKSNPKFSWVLILMNKIDLYYDHKDEAYEYYSAEGESEFSKEIQAFKKDVGTSVEFDTCSSSVILNNLKLEDGIIRPQFDQEKANKTLKELVRKICLGLDNFREDYF